MIIECPACHAKYRFDESRFEQKASKKIRCARCREVFEVANPSFAAAEDSSPTSAPVLPDAADGAGAERRALEAIPLQMPRGKRFSIAVLTGASAGEIVYVDKPRVTIGRSDADVTIDDTEASRLHAAIEIRDLLCTLHDLGSRNGTWSGGRRVEDPVEIGDKTDFQIGTTTLMLIVTNEA